MRRAECPGAERGMSAAVEAVVIVPALLLFVVLLLSLARLALAEQSIGTAAAAGARAASLARTVGEATEQGRAAALLTLDEHDVTCLDPRIRVDASGVGRAVGTRASVSVAVDCRLNLSDLALPLVPGGIQVSASRASPVDPLRGG